jgi:hypothetical protein
MTIYKRLARLEAAKPVADPIFIFRHFVGRRGDEPAYAEFGLHDEGPCRRWDRLEAETSCQFHGRIQADLQRLAPGRDIYRVSTFPAPVELEGDGNAADGQGTLHR